MRAALVAFTLLLLPGLLSQTACTRRQTAAVKMELGLYSGVEGVVRLGDSDAQIQSRGWPAGMKQDITEPPELVGLRVNQKIEWNDIGVRAFLRNGRVVLIEIQEPFLGRIQGKKMEIFPFARPPTKTWEETLTKELGPAVDHATGGRLGSDALFYTWGDISYNAMGPNQIALYRDNELAKYRQVNFGRVIRFFPKN